jgi:hypothetical protein
VNFGIVQIQYWVTHFFRLSWESRDLRQAHMSNQRLADYMAAKEDDVEEFTVNEMTQIA